MWYIISFLFGFIVGGAAVIAIALLWPDDDDDDDYWDCSVTDKHYSGGYNGRRCYPH